MGVYSNICVVARSNSCWRVVLQGCGKLLGSTSCEVRFSASSQPDKNLYVCVCVCLRFSTSAVCASSEDSDFLHRSIVPTDHFQASLPRLPVPKLEDSCRRYLAALTPVLTPEALQRSEKIVHAFRDGEGKGMW